MAVTQELIVQAAEALVARGESPTLAAVRREVGGGSYTTISETMRDWRKSKEKERIKAEIIVVPAALQEALNVAGQSLWAVATDLHAVKLAQEREALEEDRQRYAAEREDAVELADQVTMEMEQLSAALERERASSEQVREELRAALVAVDKAQTEALGLAAQVEEHRQRAAALEGSLSQTRGDLAQTVEERGRLQGRLDETEARWRSAVDAERAERLEAEASATTLRDEIGELRVQIAQLTERTERIEDLRALLHDRGK